MTRKNTIRNSLILLGGLGALALAVPALADPRCTTAPRAEWKPVHEISAHAQNLGYSVQKVERDGSCFEVEGFDKNGARIEILYNPQTGLPQTRNGIRP